jgi:membrane-associated protein
VVLLLCVAGVLGDALNYYIGYRVGPKVFTKEKSWLLNKKHLLQAQAFYEKYGGKTIFLARLIPIIRTFAPFVAGIGRMDYGRFLLFNVTGGIFWVVSLTIAGYFFGNIPVVRNNLSLVVLGIVVASIMPAVIEYLRHRRAAAAERAS